MTDQSDASISPILSALYEGRLEDAEGLASAKPELDVFEAAAIGKATALAALLRSEPELAGAWSPDGFTPLHLAAFFGRRDAVRALLEAGADPSLVSRHAQVRVTPLHSAVAQEGAADLGTAEELLTHGAPVNAGVEGGHTPLHSAAENGDVGAVRLLLSHGADPEAAREDGKTPLDLARGRGNAEVAELLAAA